MLPERSVLRAIRAERYDRSALKTSTLLVVAQLASDYHSGQWSRGYRLYCRTANALRKRSILYPLDARLNRTQQRLYRQLESRYGAIL